MPSASQIHHGVGSQEDPYFSAGRRYGMRNAGRFGRPARALVLIRHPTYRPVYLPQPDGTTMIYVQDTDRWRWYPSTAPTLPRTIRLTPGDRQTLVDVVRADGPREGSTAIVWPGEPPTRLEPPGG